MPDLRTILISGAGIAGPTLAYWLSEYGFEPTIVERAPAFREGGYIIDFWGLGFDVAEKMNLLPELKERGYRATSVRLLDPDGRQAGGFSTDVLYKELQDRVLSIQRGELARLIYGKIENRIEIVYGDSITSMEEVSGKVQVRFENSEERDFDLAVGADGLHSQVRALTFGPQQLFERSLGYHAAAFSIESYEPRDPGVYVLYSAPGRQMARFALRDNRTVFFLIFSDRCLASVPDSNSLSDCEKLDKIFRGTCIESDTILDAMHRSADLYYDSVSQVHMPAWSKGRIALVGDAAACPSLLAGQGSSLAMVASYVLAGELMKSGSDYTTAFRRYEARLKEFITKKQTNAAKFGEWFAPETNFKIFVRNQFTKLFAIPFVASLVVSDMVADNIAPPDYQAQG